ncbi:hypothetical protein HWV03_14605 [Moritella sp. 36]|uniref:hypothetical protein n=1 Tax=Moritella sp. 36 TaxID=2746233 RepID=UPI001BA88CC5|nr:hypothetical protein [Moritella sp. 36]QUM89946.1 hypothetical protein HWV03_14605 [Moritella sp. 36]
MKNIIFLLAIFIGLLNPIVNANELRLSKNVIVNYPTPAIVSHADNLLIVKYQDWYFSHEQLEPKNIYQAIDLTGLEHSFIKSMFIPKVRLELPKWLAELSKEQAASYAITDTSSTIKRSSDLDIYSAYDSANQKGIVYILEPVTIHSISYSGSDKHFSKLLSMIKGNNK